MDSTIDMSWPRPGNPAADLAHAGTADIDVPVTDIPAGDVHWDGTTMTVGDRVLSPGRYRLGDGGPVIEVFEPDDQDEHDY